MDFGRKSYGSGRSESNICKKTTGFSLLMVDKTTQAVGAPSGILNNAL